MNRILKTCIITNLLKILSYHLKKLFIYIKQIYLIQVLFKPQTKSPCKYYANEVTPIRIIFRHSKS